MSKKRRVGEQADPFSRSLAALVPDARGAAIQLGQLDAKERAALLEASLDPDGMRESLLADSNAGREARRALVDRSGDVRVARGAVKDLSALGYAWIQGTRGKIRRVLYGLPPHGPPSTTAVAALTGLRQAMTCERDRPAYVIADLQRAADQWDEVVTLVGPAWTGTLPTHDGVPLVDALRAAMANLTTALEARRVAVAAAETIRLSLRAKLWRLQGTWKDLGSGIRALLWTECQPRARRRRTPPAGDEAGQTGANAPSVVPGPALPAEAASLCPPSPMEASCAPLLTAQPIATLAAVG